MRFEETHTYEVWYQTGGFPPVRMAGEVSKEEAERVIDRSKDRDQRRRPEAAPIHYMLVCASTTRREVH
jgi:hypothetical protein